MRAWTTGMLSSRRATVVAVIVGVVLALPAVWTGRVGDDYYHRAILLGVGAVGQDREPILDFFTLMPSGEAQEPLMEAGLVTWWADRGVKVSLFRPVAVLTHLLDHALWGDTFWLHHLHSLFWYGLLIWMVGRVYQRVHGAGLVAGVAVLLFAMEDAHAMPAGWVANRHALISGVLGLTALLCHVRWRAGRGVWWLGGACVSLTVGLLAGEAALGAAAYLVAWQLAMDGGPWKHRVLALVPYGVLVGLWRLVYDGLGYGTSATGLYIDPGQHPFRFLEAVVQRWPVLMAGQWLQAPVDLVLMLPTPWVPVLTVVSVAAAVGIAVLLYPVLATRREARFWGTGMVLSLIPLCAAFPMDRLLLFCGIGAFPLLVMALVEAYRPERTDGRRGMGRRSLLGGLLVLHGPLAGLTLAARTGTLAVLFGSLFALGARTAPADSAVPEQTFLFVNGQEFPVTYLQIIRQVEGDAPAPRRIGLLSSISREVEILREDDRTLVLTPEAGFLKDPIDWLLRDPASPFEAGETVRCPDFEATVREVTSDGRPARVAFRFTHSLEDRRYRWLHWSREGARPFALPAPGEAVRLPAVSLLPW